MAEWLEWENRHSLSKDELQDYLMRVGTEGPEQPEPLAIQRQLRRLNLPFWSGGLWNQPYLYVMETNAVFDGEAEYERLAAFNLAQKVKERDNSEREST